jgi:U3 small nucleolar RNA-associated protein 11
MSSSMKNAIPRRSHKERAQPHSRTRKGLLEKRKDYQKRSKDYSQKQKALKRLAEKATERNPDEFYFGMVRRETRKGIPIAHLGKSMDVKTVRPLKMQDLAYLRTVRSVERGKVEKLRKVVQGQAFGKRILFAEDEGEGMCLVDWAS